MDAPLWYNKKLINGNGFCIYEWYRKGIRHVSDLLDEQGNIYDFENFKTRFGLRRTFSDFQALIRKIPNRWKATLNNNKNIRIINKLNVRCNIYVKLVLKDKKKGCRRFYDLMSQSTKIEQTNKWMQEFGFINDEEYKHFNSIF